MSVFDQRIITQKGKELSAATLSGGNITFTKICLGSGQYIGDIATITDLVSTEIELNISAIAKNGNEIMLSSTLLSKDITNTFEWSEVGLYAKGDDGVEILFMYGLASSTSYIDKDTLDEKTISIAVIVSNTENVTALIDSGLVYATQADIEAHNTDTSAHADIRSMIENIDLTSVTDKVTQEHDLTRNRITTQHTQTRQYINTEAQRVIDNTNTKSTEIKDHITAQHRDTRNDVSNTVTSAKDEIINNIKPGGDIVGKEMYFESVSINGSSGTVKYYTNAKGGFAKVSLEDFTLATDYSINLSIDGRVVFSDINLRKLFKCIVLTSSEKSLGFLEIPFNSNFNIAISNGQSNSSASFFIKYYINK